MGTKDWIILQAVYKEKNITKAAERLYMAQPTLTYRLQQIEREFNVKLFHRGRKGVDFTEEGELLVTHAEAMLKEQQKLEELLWNRGDEVKGTLRLSVSRTFAFYRLPQLLKAFNEKFPKVEFHVTTGVNSDVIQTVYKQEAHVAIVRGNHNWPNQSLTISEENICILSSEPIVLENLPSMRRVVYQTDSVLEMIVDNWWKNQFSKPPTSHMDVDNVEIAKRMVLNGLGYCIAPSIVLEKNNCLHQLVLTDDNQAPILWETRVLYREELADLAMVKAFIHFVQTYDLNLYEE